MHWTALIFAGLLEILWAAGLKHSDGFTRLWPSVFTIVTMVLSFVLLAYAMRALPLGTAYAVWTGIGIVGTALVGIFYFSEGLDFWRVLFIVMILAGIVGLKLLSPAQG